MGGCCSCRVNIVRRDAERDREDEKEYERDLENSIRYAYGQPNIRLGGSSRFVSMYSQQGMKNVNQDALTVWEDFTGEKDMIFCGVFDGHGPVGHKVAQYIRDNLPSKLSATIKMLQQKSHNHDHDHHNRNNNLAAQWEGCFFKSFTETDISVARDISTDSFCSGSTAVTVIKQGDRLIIGNLGDSRAVLCTRGDSNQRIPIQLTIDLKPSVPSEASRIHSCEGRIFPTKGEPDVYRVWMPDEDCPGLAMSRAFGDFCLKDYGLISIPDVFYRTLTKQDEFVVLATDGIWDVLSNNEVINIVASAPSRSLAAKTLVKHAVRTWRYKYPEAKIDDCAVICLFLNDDQPVLSISQSGKDRQQRNRLHPQNSFKSNTCEDSEDGSVVESLDEWEAAGDQVSRVNTVTNAYQWSDRAANRMRTSKYLEGVAFVY